MHVIPLNMNETFLFFQGLKILLSFYVAKSCFQASLLFFQSYVFSFLSMKPILKKFFCLLYCKYFLIFVFSPIFSYIIQWNVKLTFSFKMKHSAWLLEKENYFETILELKNLLSQNIKKSNKTRHLFNFVVLNKNLEVNKDLSTVWPWKTLTNIWLFSNFKWQVVILLLQSEKLLQILRIWGKFAKMYLAKQRIKLTCKILSVRNF